MGFGNFRRKRQLSGLLALFAGSTTFGQEPPGDLPEQDPCAGYQWTSIAGTTSYELVVMEVLSPDDLNVIIQVELPASATSWTPTLDTCLEPGSDYLWSVRGNSAEGPGEWMESVMFRTTGSWEDGQPSAAAGSSDGEAPEDAAASEPEPSSAPATSPTIRQVPQPTGVSPGAIRGLPQLGNKQASDASADPDPAGSPVVRRPVNSGSIRQVPRPGGIPSVGVREIGETEKNEPRQGNSMSLPGQEMTDARRREIAESLSERRNTFDPSQMGVLVRRQNFDYEIDYVETLNADDALSFEMQLQLGIEVSVNGAAPEDRVVFYVGVGESESTDAMHISDRYEGHGPGPHEVVMRIPVVRPLVQGNRLDGTVFVMGETLWPGLPGRQVSVKRLMVDVEPENHVTTLRRRVMRPEVAITSVRRLGDDRTVEVGDLVELEITSRLRDAGPARQGISFAVGNPGAERIESGGPTVFRQGDGEFPVVKMGFRVKEHQIQEGVFRTTLFTLKNSEARQPFSERLLMDGQPSNDRRELVYPLKRPEQVFVYPTGVPNECRSAAKAAADLWHRFNAASKEAGCLSTWKMGHPGSYKGCLVEAAKLPLKLGDKMIGHWNDLAQGGWATLGPRRITPGVNKGQTVQFGQRLFIGTIPNATGEVTINLEKVNGRAGARITACQTFPNGGALKVLDTEIEPRTENGYQVLRTIRNPAASILTVKIDQKGGPAPAPVFGYELEVTERPFVNALPAVDGFADLHLHQTARLAHAGHWFWGEMDGPPHEALQACPAPPQHPAWQGPQGARHALPFTLQSKALTVIHGEPDPFALDSWPRFDDVAHQQVYGRWLYDAHQEGLNLIVVPTVNFEPFCYLLKEFYPHQNRNWGCLDMDNIRRQIEAAHEFDRVHDWYEIALNPWHARQIISEGNLAAILSIEASRLFPAGDGDGPKQLAEAYEQGVRTLQLAHENNSRFAGAAPHRGVFEFSQWLKDPGEGGFDNYGYDKDERGKNERGLSREGERLVRAMMDYHMPIDIAHLSEQSVKDMWEIVRANRYYPLYNSHTRFKPVLNRATLKQQKEFLSNCEQVQYIEKTGGMVGLRTGDTVIMGVAAGSVANSCPGSSRSFAQLVEFGNLFSNVEMGFGTDFNGFITQVGPRYGPMACHKTTGMPNDHLNYVMAQGDPEENGSGNHWFDVKGLSHIGMLPSLVDDLDAVGADTTRLRRSAEAYLQMWERAWDDSRSRQPLESRTSCEEWYRFAGAY